MKTNLSVQATARAEAFFVCLSKIGILSYLWGLVGAMAVPDFCVRPLAEIGMKGCIIYLGIEFSMKDVKPLDQSRGHHATMEDSPKCNMCR